MSFNWPCSFKFPDMPCMKRVYKDKYSSVHWSAARNEERPSSRLSTGRRVPPSLYIEFRLFVLPKSRPGQLSSMPWKARGSVASWANRPAGVPARPARPTPLPRHALPRRGMSGFWIRQIYSSEIVDAKTWTTNGRTIASLQDNAMSPCFLGRFFVGTDVLKSPSRITNPEIQRALIRFAPRQFFFKTAKLTKKAVLDVAAEANTY